MRAIRIFQTFFCISSALAQIDEDKIVGGQDATQGQFPYQVNLIRLINQEIFLLEQYSCRYPGA